jgi:hypothetical protein
MASALEQAGATREPSEYAALNMERYITGLWTQRSPLRDAAVPYLYEKFYSAGRSDSILDGINEEISARLTLIRRPGSSIYNNNDFTPINSFYPWKYIQNGAEVIRVIADSATTFNIFDATAGQKSTIATKSGFTPVPARFLGVNTELFFTTKFDAKKILASAKTWIANTQYNVGDFIVDTNGNLQVIEANPESFTIADTAVIGLAGLGNFLVITLTTAAPTIPSNQTASFSGLTTRTALNGMTLQWVGLSAAVLDGLNLLPTQIAFINPGFTLAAPAADTGTMVALVDEPGTSGSTQPTWSITVGNVTNDGGLVTGVNWTNFGSPVQNWGLTPPAKPIKTIVPDISTRYWTPGMITLTGGTFQVIALIDPNGNIQAIIGSTSTYQNGQNPPTWNATVGALTYSGTAPWVNYGQIAPWIAGFTYGGGTSSTGVINPCVVLDTNGNLQAVQSTSISGVSGASAPTWATAVGNTTTDGTVTWVNLGPGSILWSGAIQYSYSTHSIDGSVSTAAPVKIIPSGGIGIAGNFKFTLTAPLSTDPQVDQIWIWRTAQGQATLIFVDSIPNKGSGGNWTYVDVIPDTSTTGQQALNPFIPAPIASSNNPPTMGMTGPVYHLNRVWAILNNTVVYSGGPDTITGNGNTAFPPLNEIPYLAQPIFLVPITVQNGGILVFTTDGVYIILGTGTASNPFYTTSYYPSVSVAGPYAFDVYNNSVFVMESNGKVSTLAVEYPFNPQTGYTEVGFPIGDQFQKVTTGGIATALYNPATAYISWNIGSSADTGMYVADGAVGWFRMSITNPPESGLLWAPRAAIMGGTSAVQSIETSPGIFRLLIGPTGAGPILFRDVTTNADDGTNFAAPYATIGNVVLAEPGEVAEVTFITLDSILTGTAPTAAILLDEIAATINVPFNNLNVTTADPPDIHVEASQTLYMQRFDTLQNGNGTKCRNMQLKISWAQENFPSELLAHAIYGAKHGERKSQ